MANAQAAKAWFRRPGGGTAIASHFVADDDQRRGRASSGSRTTFGFWDWVGGRYSLWSAIGLPIALAIGADGFRELLAGAHAMDEHFRTAPLEQNLPVLLGLLDVWYRNFHGFDQPRHRAVPQRLKRLPAYLQQLEMESNGKRCDMDGEPVSLRHRRPWSGASPAPTGSTPTSRCCTRARASCRSSSSARPPAPRTRSASSTICCWRTVRAGRGLAFGRRREPRDRRRRPPGPGAYRSGNRPTTTFMLDQLTPLSLGALVAAYEHQVFTSGTLWGIDRFDQWGVELGKALATRITAELTAPVGEVPSVVHDSSTAALIARYRADRDRG